MSTLVIASNVSVNSGDAVDLDPGGYQGFNLLANVSITASGATSNGVHSTNSHISGLVSGWITAGQFGVLLTQGSDTIAIGGAGRLNAGVTALSFGGGNDKIDNSGLVIGQAHAIAITDGVLRAGDTITNSGVLQAAIDSSGAAILITGGGGNTITNSGAISGGDGIRIADSQSDSPDSIINTGTLVGAAGQAIQTGDARTTLRNSGGIFGDVFLGSNADLFVNSGVVHGNVTVKGGGSVFNGAKGSVAGVVTAIGGGSSFIGGAQADIFDFTAAGAHAVMGGAGADVFRFGAKLTGATSIDGGAGDDVVLLDGDYSAGLAFRKTTMVNVERLRLAAGFGYRLNMNDATVAAGKRLSINGASLTASDDLTVNARAESDGFYTIIGGSGADTFIFDPAHFSAADIVRGGSGVANDTLRFAAAGSVSAAALAKVRGIETIALATGDNSIALPDALVASANGASVTIVGNSGIDTIDVSGVTSASSRTVIDGGRGADLITAGGALDTFVYNAASDSTGPRYDTVDAANFARDRFQLSSFAGAITAVDPTVASGALSTATFNADLASAIGKGQLGAHHAVLFEASSGSLAGDVFMVVDANGVAGYQANADLVIRLTGQVGTLKTADFT